MLAAQHGLSPIAADYVEIWRADPVKFHNTFLRKVHQDNLANLKGWSFYGMQGPRWFDPRWFGHEVAQSPVQVLKIRCR